jgi:hypothetical protein
LEVKDIWGIEVGGLVVKGEIIYNYGHFWGGKNYIYIKEKNFFSFFCGNRRKIGGMGEWGGNRYKLLK